MHIDLYIHIDIYITRLPGWPLRGALRACRGRGHAGADGAQGGEAGGAHRGARLRGDLGALRARLHGGGGLRGDLKGP